MWSAAPAARRPPLGFHWVCTTGLQSAGDNLRQRSRCVILVSIGTPPFLG